MNVFQVFHIERASGELCNSILSWKKCELKIINTHEARETDFIINRKVIYVTSLWSESKIYCLLWTDIFIIIFYLFSFSFSGDVMHYKMKRWDWISKILESSVWLIRDWKDFFYLSRLNIPRWILCLKA